MVQRSRLASKYRRNKIDIAKYEIEIVQAGRKHWGGIGEIFIFIP